MSNVHDNENYAVVVSSDKDAHLTYKVINKRTLVAEDEGPSLPNAINFAEHANSFIVNKLWEWIAPQGKATRTQMDEGGATELFHGVDESGLIQ